MKKRIESWLQKIFIKAWREYEESYPNSLSCSRDPNDSDINSRYRKGFTWQNSKSGKQFILKLKWELKEDK